MDCKTRSGRIVREETNRKVRLNKPSTLLNVTFRRLHTEVLFFTLLRFDAHYKAFSGNAAIRIRCRHIVKSAFYTLS
jgi:hypothetical protein